MTDLDLNQIKNWPSGHVGIVAIVGRPNVGKSTFINAVLDFHLCAVSSKPQTTRRNWRGVLSDSTSQIVFLDTPGAHIGKTKLGEYMLSVVMKGLSEADVILCIADPTREPGEEDRLVAERVGTAKKPVLLVLNKSDITNPEQRKATRECYLAKMPADTPVWEICAQKRRKLDPILDAIRKQLPVAPFLYDPENVTDAFTRDIASELIREAALELLHQEVPHALAVEINLWKETGKRIKVTATLHVERAGQKGIVIGRDGAMIAAIREASVARLRTLTGNFIDLTLYVKVSDDWRNRTGFLQELGLSES